MLAKNIDRKAIIALAIFIIIIIKDLLVSYLGFLPERGKANRLISWFVIMPLMVIGVILGVQIIKKNYLRYKEEGWRFLDVNIFLILPVLSYFIYILIMIVYLISFS